MARDMSECETYNPQDERKPELEEEDFFQEVVQNSLKTKKGYLREKGKR